MSKIEPFEGEVLDASQMMTRRLNRFLRQMREASGKNEKRELIMGLGFSLEAEWVKKMVDAALSTTTVYGVKNFPMPSKYSNEDDLRYPFENLLEDLADEHLTGNAAKEAILNTLALYTQETAENFACILRKKLDIGASADSFNAVYPGMIFTFPVMLAAKYDDKSKKKVVPVYPSMAEPKYDGMRVTFFVNLDDSVQGYSRDGIRQIWVEDHFAEELQILREAIYGRSACVFDGEVMHRVLNPQGMSDTWNATMSAKKKDLSGDISLHRFYVFDTMARSAWDERKCSLTQMSRTRVLQQHMDSLGNYGQLHLLVPPRFQIVNNVEEQKNFFEEILEEGYEGLMMKNPSGAYVWDRSKEWIKLKPLQTATLTITGWYKGNANTKNEHRFGGFTMEGYDENGLAIKTKVGGGYSDLMRDTFGDEQIGLEADVEYVEVTKAGSLRHPVYKRFRPRKGE